MGAAGLKGLVSLVWPREPHLEKPVLDLGMGCLVPEPASLISTPVN